MTAPSLNFSEYLALIVEDPTYREWEGCYTSTDVRGRQADRTRSTLKLKVGRIELVEQKQPVPDLSAQQPEVVETLEALEGVRKYAPEHVLLVGRPGSGKSTLLERLLWEEAGKAINDPQAKIPVLLRLRRCDSTVEALIQEVLTSYSFWVELEQIQSLLRAGRFLLLLDGVNELPSQTKTALTKFKEQYRSTTPMIFTTRELNVDGVLNIEKHLKMLPLTEPQMQEFVQGYLGQSAGDRMWRQMQGDRLQKFAETPLLLWMLCRVFAQEDTLPSNLGLVFREFAGLYDNKLKEEVPHQGSQSWWSELLQQLALSMMQADTPTALRLLLPKREAEDVLTRFLDQEKFDKPRDYAKRWLEDLLNHHLLQPVLTPNQEEQIEFRHQLIQEYYAAEALLRRLTELSDAELKCDYLNYLKWTEPIALMLALLEDDAKALQIVQWALDVDLMLGARLAGAVKLEFQEQTINLLDQLILENEQETPKWLKIELLGRSQSEAAILKIAEIAWYECIELNPRSSLLINNPDISNNYRGHLIQISQLDISTSSLARVLKNSYCSSEIACKSVEALGRIGDGIASVILGQAAQSSDGEIAYSAVHALKGIGSRKVIAQLESALEHRDEQIRWEIVEALAEIDLELTTPILLNTLKNDMYKGVRKKAIEHLEKNPSEDVTVGFLLALKDSHSEVRYRAAIALENRRESHSKLLNHEDLQIRELARKIVDILTEEPADVPEITELSITDLQVDIDISNLLNDLKSEDVLVRLEAANSLENALEEIADRRETTNLISQESIADLCGALSDPDARIRRTIAFALAKLGSKMAEPELLLALQSNFHWYRFKAAKLLGDLCVDAAVPLLCDTVLHDEDGGARRYAAEALGKIGSEQAIPALVEALKFQERQYRAARSCAAVALVKIGTAASIKAVVTAFREKNLQSSDIIYIMDCISKAEAFGYVLKYLPDLIASRVNSSITTTQTFKAVQLAQDRCKFYNYEIYQQARARREQVRQQQNNATQQGYRIGSVGILNMGPVYNQGDQVGIKKQQNKNIEDEILNEENE